MHRRNPSTFFFFFFRTKHGIWIRPDISGRPNLQTVSFAARSPQLALKESV